MGILGKLFGGVRLRFVYGGGSARSSPFNRGLYEQETVRAVIDCIASHAAKSEAMHVVLDEHARIKRIIRNSPYMKLLNQQPNPLMSGYDLKYKLVTQLESCTTAMCYIKWKGTTPEMMLPVAYTAFDVLPVAGGGYAVRFTDLGGETQVLQLEDVVMLRKFYNTLEVSGEGNAPIYNTLDMVKASDSGLIDALTVSNKVRGILKQNQAQLDKEDIKANSDEFAKRFKEAAENGGIVGVDSMEEYTPLSVSAWAANAAQMREIRGNILRYWRVSESILTSDFSDTQWQAFYESVIEPILIQMGQAFTNACFTQRERDAGNRIIFNSEMLINMSLQTKTQLLTASKEIGLFTPNEYRSMFGYHPTENGDEALVSLNYIKAKDQTKYQIKEEPSGQE